MIITKELAACKAKASVERLWKKHNIASYQEKIKLLRESMGNCR